MTIQKYMAIFAHIKLFIVAVCIASLFFALLMKPEVVYAQSSLSLEDYMENDEPGQQSLQSSEGKKPVEAAQEEVFDEAAAEEVSKDDALPDIKTRRVMLELKGFEDGSSSRRTYVDVEPELLSEKSDAELEAEIRREAFDAAITGLFPMEPNQIEKLLLKYDTIKRVAKEPVHGIPTPQINVATVSLDPGTAPLGIKTAIGHVTTLNILDITGAPWPIQDVSWAGDFEVIEPEEGGHILRITPLEKAAFGNMSIRLLTLKTPITIMLRTSTSEVQYRIDARIPEYGPFAQTPLIDGGAERVAGNALIMSVLDGVAPSGAVRLDVSGVDGRTSAYDINGLTYVRTPLTLLSPGWEQSVSSADGLHVYALNQTPIVLLSDKGRFMRASLKKSKGSVE